MSENNTLDEISALLNRIIAEKGECPREIDGETFMLGGDLPIDSLDLATIVVELQALTGRDPFQDGFIHFRTVGELARLSHLTSPKRLCFRS